MSKYTKEISQNQGERTRDIVRNRAISYVRQRYLGEKGAKRWHDHDNKLRAQLEAVYAKPLSPEMQAAANDARARILASAKPLSDKYALLGIQQGASKRDIKNAYRRKSRKLHPDVGGDAESFKQLHEAYRFLLKQAQD